MIGVPLSGGKTLNVTFRSLNTRQDIFKSYNQTNEAHSPRPLNSEQAQVSLAAAGISTPNSQQAISPRITKSSKTQVAKYTVNDHVISSGQQELGARTVLVDVPHKDELRKAVRLGVMRGVSAQKQNRQNSRKQSRGTSTNSTFMQIKMRNDGVVPFQNATAAAAINTDPLMLQPFYLTGMNNFQQTGQSPHSAHQKQQQMRGRSYDKVQQAAGAQKEGGQTKNVSQMGSQTSTDKFNDGGTKNTQTNQSMNETFELTNIIGGASIDMAQFEKNQSVDVPQNNLTALVFSSQQDGKATTRLNQQAQSKLDEGNSSIDQPSFQTEHEGTFLWNNAKIAQNNLDEKDKHKFGDRSPTGIRQSHEHNSFQFESFTGQKKSHNLSHEDHERIGQSFRVASKKPNAVDTNMALTLSAIQKTNSPTLGVLPEKTRHESNKNVIRASHQQHQRQRATQQTQRHATIDLTVANSVAQTDRTRQSLSSRKQTTARESVQDRIKKATMSSLIRQSDNQLNLQGHSMQLVDQVENRNKIAQTTGTSRPRANVPQAEFDNDPQSVKEYEQLINNPSKHQQSVSHHTHSLLEKESKSGKTKISVNDPMQISQMDPGLTKTDTQVGAVGVNDSRNGSPDITGDKYKPIASEATAELQRSITKQTSIDKEQPQPNDETVLTKVQDAPDQVDASDTKTDGQIKNGGGIKVGRQNMILMANSQEQVNGVIASSSLDTATVEVKSAMVDPLLETPSQKQQDQVQQQDAKPEISCQITSTHDDKNGQVKSTTIRHSSRLVQNFNGLDLGKAQEVVITKNDPQGIQPDLSTLNTPLTAEDDKRLNGKTTGTQQGKLIPTQMMVLDDKAAAQSKQHNTNSFAQSQNSQQEAFRDAGLSQQTLKSTDGFETTTYAGTYNQPEMQFLSDNVTNLALQNKIGNLSLTFPVSQQVHSMHYKRIFSPHETNPNDQQPIYNYCTPECSKPGTGSMYKRSRPPTMQIKPDLSNINPADLDAATRQNMIAIGINFSTKRVNRLKPYESHATKKRKWRNYFNTEKNNEKRTRNRTLEAREALSPQAIDYDGNLSNADKLQILQRRLTAWATFDKGSGIGSEPGKLVGATLSHTIDQISYMNATDNKVITAGHHDPVLASLPVDIRNLQTPNIAKSAVGSSRANAKIQIKNLIEKSQANALTYKQRIQLDSSIRERTLQTQGCQRTNFKNVKKSTNASNTQVSQNYQLDSLIQQTDQSSLIPLVDRKGEYPITQVQSRLNQVMAKKKHDSMVWTPPDDNQGRSSIMGESDRIGGATLISKSKEYQIRQRSQDSQNSEDKDIITDNNGERPKFASFSLQVRRRTDQQENFFSRTMTSWQNAPIEVEDQTVQEMLARPQRSVDVSEAFRNQKAKQIAKIQQSIQNDSMSIARDITDSIHGSQLSMQLAEIAPQKSVISPNTGINFETLKFQFVPKTAAVQHKMKSFCCNVPNNLQGRLPYQNSQTQKAGLSPKTPAVRHGIFGSSKAGNVSQQAAETTRKQQPAIVKQYTRPLVSDAAKCQIQLHESLNAMLNKRKPQAGTIVIKEDQATKRRVNRADLRNLHTYNTFRERVQSVHVPQLLEQVKNNVPQSKSPIMNALNDPKRVNAFAVVNFKRDQIPGSLNGRVLHTSQLTMTPEMQLDFMLQNQK